MPELPEVEAARRAVHEFCCGRRIVEASVANDSIVIDGVLPAALESSLVGRSILGTHRKGKNLWLELDARPWPSFQFGMTGAFNIKGKEITKYKRAAVSDKEEWPSKFSKVFFKLDDGLEVSFTDKRRLARVRLFDDPIMVPPISELGPDAFLELPVETNFMGSILKKRCPIKVLIMDQSFLAGIGNWVADEVLYQARIHPEQVASSLSEVECARLHNTIREVLKLSVNVNADSEMFPKHWIFHHRWNKKPGEVEGEKISFITVGGRTSAIVPALQKCTSQSLRKKETATKADDENGTDSAATGLKKKRERKPQTGKAVGLSEDDDINAKENTRSKRSAKNLLSTSKAEIRKGRGSKKLGHKIEEKEVDRKVGTPKGRNAGKRSEHKEESPESQLELGKKKRKTAAKKQSLKDATRAQTVSSAHVEAGMKPPVKSTEKVISIGTEEEREVNKVTLSNTSKKSRGQKRKKGAD